MARGTARGTRGTLQLIQDWPLGRVLVLALAAGLLGYALWQLARGLLDVTDRGDGAGGLLKRAGYVVSGAAHLGLSWFALRLALNIGAAQKAAGQEAEDAAARVLLDLPGGALLLGTAGIVVTGMGLGLVYTGLRSSFMKRVSLDGQAGKRERLMQALGQIGIAARGLLLAAIGAAVIRTALKDRAELMLDTSEALDWLRDLTAGRWALGLVSAGIAAYGLWCFVQARYRRIPGQAVD